MAVGCGVLRKGPKLKHWEGLRMRGNRGVFYTFAPAPHHRGNKLDDKMAIPVMMEAIRQFLLVE